MSNVYLWKIWIRALNMRSGFQHAVKRQGLCKHSKVVYTGRRFLNRTRWVQRREERANVRDEWGFFFCHLRNAASVCDLLNEPSFRCWRMWLASEVPYWSNESFGLASLSRVPLFPQSAPSKSIHVIFRSHLSQREALNVWLFDLSSVNASNHIRCLPKGTIIFVGIQIARFTVYYSMFFFPVFSLMITEFSIFVQVNPLPLLNPV